jgi:hypothetical protein
VISLKFYGEEPFVYSIFYKLVDEEEVILEKYGPWDNLEWATEWSNNHLAKLNEEETPE